VDITWKKEVMKSEKKTFTIKLLVLLIGLIMISLVFTINKLLINNLRNEVNQQVELLAKSYSEAINSKNEEDIRFVMDILLPSLNFPIIITSNNEISSIMNLDIDFKLENKNEYDEIWKIVERMDANFDSIDLNWNGIKWGEIHFSDPKLINQLKWMPYIEILCVILFLFVFFWAFRIIMLSERNLIYVGMAKETAHQLGTPISSLMGWLKLLNDNKEDKSSILQSMDEDIIRLKDISERFSKIGSHPQLVTIEIFNLLSSIVNYMEMRLPRNSNISLELKGKQNIEIQGDKILLIWAIENLLKNAVDALMGGKGYIEIDVKDIDNETLIIISDTGRGINRKYWKNIFNPGYSTKTRGWGLGLSLTLRIIKEIHGGKIYLHSSMPGKTIFHIILKNK
tara:strand:- start:1796 stop:2986 length:1191 start_codon:yes stop_codon:yes gene_type:complete